MEKEPGARREFHILSSWRLERSAGRGGGGEQGEDGSLAVEDDKEQLHGCAGEWFLV